MKDFESRFRRKSEGMWLPETAVDLETLDILAGFGIKFTILGPRQVKRVRKIGDREWKDVNGENFDIKMPYLCKLPSGRAIAIFFYDGGISHDVAFNNLLENGENFARRLMNAFNPQVNKPQLVHIATDGETYGHHHRFGDMALAYCFYYLESNKFAKRTIYGEYLEKNPPVYEVEIFENSSWSCVHCVERWRKDCGCNSGAHPGWHQDWRGPLKDAMDWLRDTVGSIYEEEISEYVKDPWKTRDDFIEVILDRSSENIERFLSEHNSKKLSRQEKIEVLKLLEIQRHAMLMYTSCGWFFDDISGIEAVQVIQYAARVIQLAQEVSGVSLEETYAGLLERAPSNIPKFKNGKGVYEKLIKTSVLDLLRVGGHYAISSIFEDYPETVKLYSYTCTSRSYDCMESGKRKLAVGRTTIRSDITCEENTITFAVLHFGDHNLIAKAHHYEDEDKFSDMCRRIKGAFAKSDVSEVIRLMDEYFGRYSYTLWHLFKDEQRKILDQIFSQTLKDTEDSFRRIYEEHYPIMQVANKMGLPLPKSLVSVVGLVFSADIQALLEREEFDLDELRKIAEEVREWHLSLDMTTLGFIAGRKIRGLMKKLSNEPEEIILFEGIIDLLKGVKMLGLDLNLWEVQNIYFSVGRKFFNIMRDRAKKNDDHAQKWLEYFNNLGGYLSVRISSEGKNE